MLAEDVRLLLDTARSGMVPVAWSRPGFAARVRVAQRQLACLHSWRSLSDSFARESLHAHPIAAEPTPIRVAYAIRWLELVADVVIPDWGTWAAPTPGGQPG